VSDFVMSVINERILPASDFPFGLYPRDMLTRRSSTVVEFETLRGADGMGTSGWVRRVVQDYVAVSTESAKPQLELY
jgi:hypothetical protein